MRGYTTQDRISYWLFKDRIPVVKLLIVANLLTFVMVGLFHVQAIAQFLGFSTAQMMSTPWTLFTYPLVTGRIDMISLLFSGYWLWVAGGSLERSWGSRKFGIYFFLMSAVTALGLWAGSILTGIPVGLAGLWMPLAGATVAFAMQNPEQQILFFFVIPLKLKYLALIDAAIVLFQYGQMHLLLGVFALAGCAASFWYVRGGMYAFSFAESGQGEVIRINPPHAVRRGWSPARWYREYQDKKRLRDLFKE